MDVLVPVVEDAEHIGRHHVANEGCPFEPLGAGGHRALLCKNKCEPEDEADLRVASSGQVVDEGEVAVEPVPPHGYLPLQRDTAPIGALVT